MSDETIVNPYAGFSQGAFDDTPVIFKNVRFASNVNYKDGDGNLPIVLNFDLTNEDGDVREDQLLSIGKGFNAKDDGARVEHENPRKNKSQGFGAGTKAQTFLDSLAACDLEGLIQHGEKVDASPRDAAFWEGLACYVVEEEQSYTTKAGEERKYRELKAAEIYNWDGVIPSDEVEAPVAKPAPKKAAAKKTPPVKVEAPVVETSDSQFGLADDVFAKLVDLAKTSADYDTFLVAAYDLDEIADDDVQAVVDDEAGLYAAHGQF